MPDTARLIEGESAAQQGRGLATKVRSDELLDPVGVRELLRPSDVVLDVRCGEGERCIGLASALGSDGRIIGIESDERALAAARARLAREDGRGARAGVRFLRVDVRDLAEDLEESARYVSRNPILDAESLDDFENWRASRRDRAAAIATASVDVALALGGFRHLQRQHDRRRALEQLYTVLKPGGRLVWSDMVSDEVVPAALGQRREFLNAGLAGTFAEGEFHAALRAAGFVGTRCLSWPSAPSHTVEGIEFRVIGVMAIKPTGTECLDRGDAVIYRGPYAQAIDDEGHIFVRGERMAVCERTFAFLTEGPLRADFIGVPGLPGREPVAWCAPPGTKRAPQETKALDQAPVCKPGSGCC